MQLAPLWVNSVIVPDDVIAAVGFIDRRFQRFRCVEQGGRRQVQGTVF